MNCTAQRTWSVSTKVAFQFVVLSKDWHFTRGKRAEDGTSQHLPQAAFKFKAFKTAWNFGCLRSHGPETVPTTGWTGQSTAIPASWSQPYSQQGSWHIPRPGLHLIPYTYQTVALPTKLPVKNSTIRKKAEVVHWLMHTRFQNQYTGYASECTMHYAVGNT